jgi:hypothetical protein
MTTELHKVNIHLIQKIDIRSSVKEEAILVEISPCLKFKVPSSNPDIVDKY